MWVHLTVFALSMYTDIHQGLIFRSDLTHGDSYQGPDVSWVFEFFRPNFRTCNIQDTVRIPCPSSSGTCYKFLFDFNLWPTAFSFHLANGCGTGRGETSGCYEVHSYNKEFHVYGSKESGYKETVSNAISLYVKLEVKRGSVKFYSSNGMIRYYSHSTLFTGDHITLSMNRVYDLKAFPSHTGSG